MIEVQFYRTSAGACPVEEFLDSLNAKQAQKVLWVFENSAGTAASAAVVFQKTGRHGQSMGGAGRIWRRCLSVAGILGRRIVRYFNEWICEENPENTGARNRDGRAAQARPSKPEKTEMKNDVEKYIAKRKSADETFAKDFDAGYEEFKIGVMLREARERAGVTQETLARITRTRKSAISRLENHAQDMRLSTVLRVARALGKAVRIELVEAA
ncbi:MAG: helix-turn-helix domain-containing protein [Limisphaerales bacterium]